MPPAAGKPPLSGALCNHALCLYACLLWSVRLWCHSIFPIWFGKLFKIRSSCPFLYVQALTLRNCMAISDRSMYALAGHCTQLQVSCAGMTTMTVLFYKRILVCWKSSFLGVFSMVTASSGDLSKWAHLCVHWRSQ